MSNKPVLEEKLLRFAAPALYQKMAETFSTLNIHTFDIHGTVVKREDGYEVTLRFSPSFSQSATTKVSFEQAIKPDEEVVRFFEETAEKCKSELISDYYKMIKL
ncbi:hypothetical protein QNH39_14350 [Neobacillus novalis]|uniref:Uncharacterized protein n=1 Tax=Neobacillus novalis TaxID=220687 RepID=A0AA95MNB2_9BACI|nr:hypothetical protein [Neobacillus novalis]WHY83868.1 hypothetical protein QNH39_14350 [Neobacillus novalis]